MSRGTTYHWPLAFLLVALCGLLFVTLKPYHGNVTALFHMDQSTYRQHSPLEKNFVILDVPGYDGEQYYQIARHLLSVFIPSQWPDITSHSVTIAYSYQRFLLPLTAFLLSFGNRALLPYSFLFIQLVSVIGVFWIVAKRFPHKAAYALAIALSPAAMVGLHFSLAEPLTLLILTAFLVRFIDHKKLHTIDIILLSLFVLGREVNIIFVISLLPYLCWKKRWHDAFLLIIPIATFFCLHLLIFKIFQEIPFLWSTDKRAFPLSAITDILVGHKGYNMYTLSSIALFLGFVVPATLWSLWNLWKKQTRIFLPLFSLLFLGVMMTMPDHIWGSITSIGRVITPVYPLVILQTVERDTPVARAIAIAIVALGLGIGLSLALIPHPYTLT
jgi:hypothetical protein